MVFSGLLPAPPESHPSIRSRVALIHDNIRSLFVTDMPYKIEQQVVSVAKSLKTIERRFDEVESDMKRSRIKWLELFEDIPKQNNDAEVSEFKYRWGKALITHYATTDPNGKERYREAMRREAYFHFIGVSLLSPEWSHRYSDAYFDLSFLSVWKYQQDAETEALCRARKDAMIAAASNSPVYRNWLER